MATCPYRYQVTTIKRNGLPIFNDFNNDWFEMRVKVIYINFCSYSEAFFELKKVDYRSNLGERSEPIFFWEDFAL